jgi:radical SAM-linked protein
VDAGSETTPGQARESAGAADAEPAVPAVARQRWRLVVARPADAPALAGRELTESWEGALEASGLPLFRAPGRARGRVAFGAPLPVSMVAEGELLDIVLVEVMPIWRVRECLTGRLPEGWRLVGLHDVWIGEPALAGRIAAADYRIDLGAADADAIASACDALLVAETLPRERAKGNSTVRYDLRPLLVDVAVVEPGPPLLLRTRTRFHPVLGTGRPDEVAAALGEAAGTELVIGSMVRERLILTDEVTSGP